MKYLITILLILISQPVFATYSIIACDSMTRECGVAVQTNNLAVGASVPYAKAGIGAFVSQFETNPIYGPRALELMMQIKSPQQIIAQLLKEDGNFDGQGIEARQIAIIILDGRAAAYTGQMAQSSEWAGTRSGKGYSVQGNGLAGPQVLAEMERAFLKTSGTLAKRLLEALVAGDASGGQTTGKQSAALLVRTPTGYPLDIDLRVDSSDEPVRHLQVLFKMHSARQQVIQAQIVARKGDLATAKNLMIAAVAQAESWPRVWLQAARVAVDIQEPDLALQYLNLAFSTNQAWVKTEIGSGKYAILGNHPLFASWVTDQQKMSVLAEYQKLIIEPKFAAETGVGASLKLLEVNRPMQALSILNRLDKTARIYSLMADAYSAGGNYEKALEFSQMAVQEEPTNKRYRLQAARIQSMRLMK